MILILDANTLVSDPRLESHSWKTLTDASSRGRVSVVVPDFTVIEAAATLRRKHSDLLTRIKAQLVHWGRRGRVMLESSSDFLETESKSTDRELRTLLVNAGVSVVRGVNVSHELIVRRASARTRPFDDRGSGYRDTLLWFFVLDIYARFADRQHVAFVSNDAAAFGAKGDSGLNDLHAHLLRDVRSVDSKRQSSVVSDAYPLTWYRTLSQVEIPDLFTDDEATSASYLEDARLEQALIDLLGSELPLEIPSTSSPLGFGQGGTTITEVRSCRLTEAIGRQYKERLGVVAFDFIAEFDVRFSGIGVTTSDGYGPVNVTANGPALGTGRVDFIAATDTFADLEITWSLP